ncbi:hypothetical protein INR49_006689 [Caranx melampygus]|nr:hypothetical protein INR49_006689 [Caranx melampygus]
MWRILVRNQRRSGFSSAAEAPHQNRPVGGGAASGTEPVSAMRRVHRQEEVFKDRGQNVSTNI